MSALALAALVALQEPPVAAEKERLRAKRPLTEAERKEYRSPAPGGPEVEPRGSYALAVVPLGFSDAAPSGKDLAKLFFDRLAGYFAQASGRRFELRGKVCAPVRLEVARAAFKEAEVAVAMAAFLGRDEGAFDGVAFVAAGGLGARGTALWPHKETARAGDRKIDYLILTEEPEERALGIAAHEFMHLLGLADKYDDEKASVGGACILGTGYDAKNPAPPCADCRSKLGWARLASVDPRREAKIVLGADPALRVPLNADASETLLLETRERLYVWHLGGGKKIELLGRFPTDASDRLTPLSDPPFRGRTVGAWPVWITDIRLEGGKAYFTVGPSAPLTALEEWRRAHVGRRIGD